MKISLRLAVSSILGALAYLGLAIWGMGGFSAFFGHPQLTLIAIATLLMVVAALYSEVNLSSGEQEDQGNRWVLPVFGVIGLLSGFVPAYSDRIDFCTFGGEGLRWLGALLFILGRRFSGLVAIQPNHRLVVDGLYRHLRNPSYLGLLVNALGWALAFRSGLGLLLAALTLVPLIARIHAEETLLLKHFGKEYEAYCARSWRLLPGLY